MEHQDQSQHATTPKAKRVLACVLCQHRKVKCDRRFPCANCQKANTQCIPAALVPKQRRRRFPEKILLDRLRQYENLLRKHKIDFEPLHGTNADKPHSNIEHDEDSHDEIAADTPGSNSIVKEEPVDDSPQLAKSYWNAMNHKPQNLGPEEAAVDEDSSPDDVQEKVITSLLDERYDGDEHLFFGLRSENFDLSSLHPSQSQIFKLWQIYLENVDPLLKITHAPTLQARIVDAASNISNIEPNLEAVMFSIYCVAIMTLGDSECEKNFGLPSKDLLKTYSFGCREALLNCGISRSTDVEGLTALCLYLIAVRTTLDPRIVFSMLGVADRIAKRIGIHIEGLNAKQNALNAEIRRRLWWALTIFDDRISEMSGFKDAALTPNWDCKIPANINDVDLRSEMRVAPSTTNDMTEAIFIVVRGEIGNFVRRSVFHLDFTNPVLKNFITDVQHGPIRRAGELTDLEKMIEDRYLRHCNPDIPLHLITLWSTRMILAKKMLQDHYSRLAVVPQKQTDEERDLALTYAMTMLVADTILTKSPLTKRFSWYLYLYFPFPAYIHLVQDLRRRPGGSLVEKAWQVLNDNYNVRFLDPYRDHGMFFKLFPRALNAAWRARQTWTRNQGLPDPVPPTMIHSIQTITAAMASTSLQSEEDMTTTTSSMNTNVNINTGASASTSVSEVPSDDLTPASSGFDIGNDMPMSNFPGFAMLPPDFWDLSVPMDLDNVQTNWPGMNWSSTPYPW